MEEKKYLAMKNSGIVNIVSGIVTIATGVAIGILLIVSGAKLLSGKKDITF